MSALPGLDLPVRTSRFAMGAWLPSRLLALAALAIAVAVLLPVVGVIAAFATPRTELLAHLAQTVLPTYVANTLVLLCVVGVGVAVVGVACAWLVSRCEFPGRALFEWALLLPLAMPAYVIAYVYTDFFQYSGPVQSALRVLTGWQRSDYWWPDPRSLAGAAMVFIAVLYPYVYMLARVAFTEQPASVAEASRTLGMGPWRSFLRVSLPVARPAIAGGIALALMETLADFGAVSYFGVDTFTTGIFRAWFSFGDRIAAAQLAAFLLGFVVLLLALERLNRGRARFADRATRKHDTRARLGFRDAVMTLAFLSGVLLMGFVLPVVLLVRLIVKDDTRIAWARFAELAGNSLSLALFAAAAALVAALCVAYHARTRGTRVARVLAWASGLGYAIPGLIVAVGMLIPLTHVDRLLAAQLSALTQRSWGLVLTGTAAALVVAYVVRFLAVALQSIGAGLTRITPSMDEASRSLGLTPTQTLRRVHLPILGRSLAAAFVLVFVDVMKELPATFVMRPFNFDTLAVETYNLARDERLAEAAVPSLAIVIVGLIPVLLTLRLAAHRARRPQE